MEQVALNSVLKSSQPLIQEITEKSHVDVNKCYQCGTCAAGCPVAYLSDYSPRQIVRMLQSGLVEDVFKSRMIWLCIGCGNCLSRCPRKIDVPHLHDTLRIISKEKGFPPAEKGVDVFIDSFLTTVRMTGRLYEAGLTMLYNTRSGNLMAGMDVAPHMMKLGKISPFPHLIKGRGEVARIFKKVQEAKGGK
ncbi:MAG: 4Fe-4S dicluster domain-containing protein [Candidatus Syntrophonatronum acetioxidans]|uniref:4Fe-4S dicluster domain-containing protein n=1 Tax=Candidatus Syntrophonatronum acetioxidans TaxID=1795816 RepID=A0A424YCS0_9FIRM|nr:MAG: 4Fe-4S dicluster domain-containing protein [Candidatus Syntrophonatronum acetioxidans]